MAWICQDLGYLVRIHLDGKAARNLRVNADLLEPTIQDEPNDFHGAAVGLFGGRPDRKKVPVPLWIKWSAFSEQPVQEIVEVPLRKGMILDRTASSLKERLDEASLKQKPFVRAGSVQIFADLLEIHEFGQAFHEPASVS